MQQILNDNTIRKPWHDYGSRNNDTEKIQIPKIYSPFGFHYMLDAPTSSSVRREDDKVTYVNKGQFYGVTLDYQPDSELPQLKSPTVKSVIHAGFQVIQPPSSPPCYNSPILGTENQRKRRSRLGNSGIKGNIQ